MTGEVAQAVRRSGLVALISMASVVLAATPASAHAAGGPQPTNIKVDLAGVVPPVAGVSVRLLDLGKRVRLANRGGTEITVLGYEGEPYLRIGPAGVFENTRSPTLYRNRTTAGGGPSQVPASASASAAPDWRLVSHGSSVTWGDDRPRRVPSGPGVSRWEIPLRNGASDSAVVGTVQRTAGRSALPWLAGALALGIAVVLVGRTPGWGAGLSAFTAVLIAADVVHAIGLASLSASGAGDAMVRLLSGSYLSVAAWIVGVFAVIGLQREREGGLLAGCFCGAVIGVLSGLTDLTALTRSQLPVTLPATFARLTVTVAAGVGLGLVVACATRLVRMTPASRPPGGAPARDPVEGAAT